MLALPCIVALLLLALAPAEAKLSNAELMYQRGGRASPATEKFEIAAAAKVDLERDLKGKTMVFVAGAHHSGTAPLVCAGEGGGRERG